MNKFDYVANKLKEKIDENLLPGVSLFISENGKDFMKNILIIKVMKYLDLPL